MSGSTSLHLTSARQQCPAGRGLRDEFYSRLAPGSVLVDLFEHLSGVHFFLKDDHGRTIAFNSLLRSRLGLPAEEDVIGLTDYDLFSRQQADRYRDARDAGEVLAPAKDVGQMDQVIQNSTTNGVLQLTFAILTIIVVANAAIVWVRALRAGGLPTTEVPATPSAIVAPSDFLATAEEKAAVRAWEESRLTGSRQ